MLYLISAPPRTGKTLRAIKIIFERLNEGRIVYTNIIGIKIDGVISVSSNIDHPFDWRDLPNDSVVIWDEAHEHPAFSDRNLIRDKDKMAQVREIGTSLLLHGHFGFDIYLITQKPNLLHADVLAAVSTHYIMRRKFGMDMAVIWEFGEAITTFSKSSADSALNKTLWKYPKHLYKFYVSSEKHNVKFTFPIKYIVFACIPLLLFYFGYSKASDTTFFGLFGKKEKQKTEETIKSNQEVKPQIVHLDSDDPTKKKLEELQAQSLGITVDQLREMRKEKQQTECKKLENINNPECLEISKNQYNSLNNSGNYPISYNPNDPYDTQISERINVQVTDFPRVSGCAKYDGKYYAFDQQGNRMNVDSTVCKRWFSGEKPFNYFATNNQFGRSGFVSTETFVNSSTQQNQTFDRTQDVQYANNYVQETPTLTHNKYAINGANAL